jgi:hypothetical protein
LFVRWVDAVDEIAAEIKVTVEVLEGTALVELLARLGVNDSEGIATGLPPGTFIVNDDSALERDFDGVVAGRKDTPDDNALIRAGLRTNDQISFFGTGQSPQ